MRRILTQYISRNNAERGQSLVEVSVGFVVILIILTGLLDLGRAYFAYIALEDAAGEGALYLALNPACVTAADSDPLLGIDCVGVTGMDNAEARVRNAGGDFVDWDEVDIDFDVPSASVGETVRVTVSFDFELIMPILPQFVGINPLRLNATATQTIIRE